MMNVSGGDVEFSSDDVVEKIEADSADIYTRRLIAELRTLQNLAQQKMMAPQMTNDESKRLVAEVEFWKSGIELLETLWPLVHRY